MKKAIFLSIILVFLFSATAYGDDNTQYAKQLKGIGVFKGTDQGLELERETQNLMPLSF
jgi:hypothetical protein